MSVAVADQHSDENWRYANLRSAAPRRDARSGGRGHGARMPIALPAAPCRTTSAGCSSTGNCARTVRARALTRCAPLLNARDAGEGLRRRTARCRTLPPRARDFALARVNGEARRPGAAHRAARLAPRPASNSTFVASASGRAGTSYPRVQVHAGRGAQLRSWSATSARAARDSAVNAAFDLALRADATHRSLPPAELRRRRELLRHAGCARRRTRGISPAHRHAGWAHLPLHHPGQARRPRRALRADRWQHRQRHPDARRICRDRTRRRRHRDARTLSRHRHGPRQARLQRQDDRARSARRARIPTSR